MCKDFAIIAAIICLCVHRTWSLSSRTFPTGFRFGAATAAYQIEGGWDEDGKGESIWDHLAHYNPEFFTNGETGDVACDSYHHYRDDVEMLRFLGVDFYRFSISWARIMPHGLPNQINQDGIEYYNKLIDALLEAGIQPMVTMYHWDLPQYLQQIGGWANPRMQTYFTDYARVIIREFGDRVQYWSTFNEPAQICRSGYGGVTAPPVLGQSGIADYICDYNLLRAHASVYHMYDSEF